MPLALAAAGTFEQSQCATLALPGFGETRAVPAGLSKSVAILGGQVSQLELMRAQQVSPLSPAAGPLLAGTGLVPRWGGECAMFVRAQTNFADIRPGRGSVAGADDFLASKRLAVRKTGFDAQWKRVGHGSISAGIVGIGRGQPQHATIAAVNSWANAKIRYVEDRELYGQADYWADAKTTLSRRAGDCEDIAIAKMALLAGAGVHRKDMYLTIARDLVRNADHALLVVRSQDKFWLLDNNTDRVLDASTANDYRPILSYSAGGKWLHGY